MGCSCLLPDLARRSALSVLSFPGIPQWAGIHCRTTVYSWGRSCRSFTVSAVGALAGQGYWRLGTEGLL